VAAVVVFHVLSDRGTEILDELQQLVGRREAVLDREGIPSRVALAADVEVTQCDQVLVELIRIIADASGVCKKAQGSGYCAESQKFRHQCLGGVVRLG
jgi:hypothetical protein